MTLVILVTTLRFLVSAYEADSLDCRVESSNLEHVAKLRLYGAECAPLAKVRLQRERVAVAGADTFQVWDDGCASYFVAVVDSSENESCWTSYTVGIPPVGVGPQIVVREVFYDIQGRRVSKPLPSGIYYASKARRWIVVLR